VKFEPKKDKPHIWFMVATQQWYCQRGFDYGIGVTPNAAYREMKKNEW